MLALWYIHRQVKIKSKVDICSLLIPLKSQLQIKICTWTGKTLVYARPRSGMFK